MYTEVQVLYPDTGWPAPLLRRSECGLMVVDRGTESASESRSRPRGHVHAHINVRGSHSTHSYGKATPTGTGTTPLSASRSLSRSAKSWAAKVEPVYGCESSMTLL